MELKSDTAPRGGGRGRGRGRGRARGRGRGRGRVRVTDGDLEDGRGGAEQLDDGVHAEVEVGARAVHLVQEAHARHLLEVG